MRPYELMYLCPPAIDEERLGAVSDRIQQAITTLGGKVDKVVPHAKRRHRSEALKKSSLCLMRELRNFDRQRRS